MIAPKIKTDSKPSLNIIAKDEIKAIIGAIVPVPETRRSDSSRLLSIAITALSISSTGAFSLIKFLSVANSNSTWKVKSGAIARKGISTYS